MEQLHKFSIYVRPQASVQAVGAIQEQLQQHGWHLEMNKSLPLEFSFLESHQELAVAVREALLSIVNKHPALKAREQEPDIPNAVYVYYEPSAGLDQATAMWIVMTEAHEAAARFELHQPT